MGRKNLKVTSPSLKNEGYVDHLKDNRAVIKCRKKIFFTLF